MAADEKQEKTPITIKKYANRRLYNTATSCYVTLDYLSEMVKADQDFVVQDARSGDDITRSVLTQIIVEEEAKGKHLLPISFLRKVISLYGDTMQQMLLPRYLEQSMQAFSQNNEQMTKYLQETFGTMFPQGSMEKMGKQNMAMFENAMRMFMPFSTPSNRETKKPANGQAQPAATSPAATTAKDAAPKDKLQQTQIDDMQRKLNELQEQIAALTKSP